MIFNPSTTATNIRREVAVALGGYGKANAEIYAEKIGKKIGKLNLTKDEVIMLADFIVTQDAYMVTGATGDPIRVDDALASDVVAFLYPTTPSPRKETKTMYTNTDHLLDFVPSSPLCLCSSTWMGNQIGYDLVLDLGSGKPRIEETNSSNNTITFFRCHGHEVVMANITGADASEIVDWYNTEIAPKVEQIVEGYSSVWDGNNHVASLTEESSEAMLALVEWAQDNVPSLPEGYGYWEAAEYLQHGEFPVTAESSDEELRDLAQTLVSEAVVEGALIDEDEVVNFLQRLRDKEQEKID